MATKPWKVLKFGGTSVATAERWATIGDRIVALLPTHRVWVVASAVAGVSNRLEQAVREALEGDPAPSIAALRATHTELARSLGLPPEELPEVEQILSDLESRLAGVRLGGEAPPRLVARIMAAGEMLSTRIGAAGLARRGLPVRWVDARRLLTARSAARSDHIRYLEAEVPALRACEAAENEAPGATVVLTQGFIARNAEGETCLLGRGGSDTSGALFAALLGAEELEIWTDVHGLFTADPRLVPTARLIRRIGYREAQELAAMGARVLHPRCLGPVAEHRIPLSIRNTGDPGHSGTRIESTGEDHPAVTAVTCRRGVTLLTLSTLAMWEAPGFLARVFAPFEELDVSVDLVATSQAAVSVTLDKIPGGYGSPVFKQLLERLQLMGQVEVVHPCGVVSVVGRRMRAALHELGPAMSVFQERPVHLVAFASEDLNLSFVVDEGDATNLVVGLHRRLFAARGEDPRLGETWEVLGGMAQPERAPGGWWRSARGRLLELAPPDKAVYVYDLKTVGDQARRLRAALPSVGRLYYSMKANANPRVLETVAAHGFGIECVSLAEVLHAREVLGSEVEILFTPNFCPTQEYRLALDAGAEVTVDGAGPLELAPETFRGREIGLRIDPGRGLGHHEKVITAGAQAKFGQRADEIDEVLGAADRARAKVVGLHAHVGSGILDPSAWAMTGQKLLALAERVRTIRWIDLGGGLGVIERPGQEGLDLEAVERHLAGLGCRGLQIELRLEPGRFLVSEAGVLLARVTQVRTKRGARYVGVATGMNSLIRPALYGAWHGIHNLTRLGEALVSYCNVVGPICETGDVLGRDRLLPATRPGDVLLVENAGAYGAVMASRYNLRAPAEEVVLDDRDSRDPVVP